MALKPRAKPSGEVLRRLIHFLNGAFGRIFGQGNIAWQFDESAAQHMAFTPAIGTANELANGQRIQEFIRQQDHGHFGQACHIRMPRGHSITKLRRLRAA